jgi:hypothetical protein
MTGLITANLPAPSLFTVIVGVVPPKVSVEVLGVPALIVQLNAGLAAWFPKIKELMLWLPSRVTVVAAVTLRVLKSAVSPVVVGSVPPDQFAWLAQLPLALPLLKWVQVKVAARAEVAAPNVKASRRTVVSREASQRLAREGLLFMVSMALIFDLWFSVLDCPPWHDRPSGWARIYLEVGFITLFFSLRTATGNFRLSAGLIHSSATLAGAPKAHIPQMDRFPVTAESAATRDFRPVA